MDKHFYVYIFLLLYVYVIICSIIYISSMGTIYRYRARRILKLKETFGKDIKDLLYKVEIDSEISVNEIDYIMKKLKRRMYRRTFNSIIEDFNKEDVKNIKTTKKFMLYFEDYILMLLRKYKTNETLRKVNTIYMLGQFGVNKPYINIFLLRKLENKSLYIRFNALSSIALIGDVNSFLECIVYFSQKGTIINDELFLDVINNFSGDMELLDKKLLASFEKLSPNMKGIVVNHFTNREYRASASTLLLLLNLKNTNKNLKLCILKYFEKINYPSAEKVIISILDTHHWEIRAASVKALGNYGGIIVKNTLIKVLNDKNWTVRFNSAITLINDINNFESIEGLLLSSDSIAKEVLMHILLKDYSKNSREYIERLREVQAKSVKEELYVREYH